MQAVDSAERARVLLDDVQSATLHLSGLPSRRDVQRLFRRTASLSRKVAELEHQVGRLEALLEREPARKTG